MSSSDHTDGGDTLLVDLSLGARYRVDAVGWAASGARSFVANGVVTASPAAVLAVTPDTGQSWQGEFFGHRDALCYVAATADPTLMLVVAGGVGYVVDVIDPARYTVLDLRPIRTVLIAAHARLVVCAGTVALTALGGGGKQVWSTARLVADGIEEVRVGSDFVLVRGRGTVGAREIEITVDIYTGKVLSTE
jgi:hypothetical protein